MYSNGGCNILESVKLDEGDFGKRRNGALSLAVIGDGAPRKTDRNTLRRALSQEGHQCVAGWEPPDYICKGDVKGRCNACWVSGILGQDGDDVRHPGGILREAYS